MKRHQVITSAGLVEKPWYWPEASVAGWITWRLRHLVPLRVWVAIHVLRGRPTMYRLDYPAGTNIPMPPGMTDGLIADCTSGVARGAKP